MAAVLAGVALAPAGAEAARTVVTLSFDDVRASQLNALPILDRFGMKGSFFVNSARVGRAGRLTWDQVRGLRDAGHEIGGHTLDHEDLTKLSDAEARRQVCDDRAALVAQGFDPVSFAYPFGDADATAAAIVGGCGYRLARAHGGISTAETIPPPDPLRLRSSRSLRRTDDLGYLQDRVLLAETTGGWINLNFHDVCAGCSGTYVVAPALLEAFLSWLAPRAASHDTVVLPMGLAFADDAAPPSVVLTGPTDGATVEGLVPLSALATDDVGVARVEFLVDGVVVASDATEPFTGTWDATAFPNATATLEARATDTAGNATLSDPVLVVVATPPPDPTPPPARPRTVVTLSFDDALASQLNALPILDAFGMKASFFPGADRVGGSGRLTLEQLRAVRDAGHEIGGHTLGHVDLTAVSDAEAVRQVCDERAALVALGFAAPTSFAYPFGAADATAEAIVAGCGYRFARAHGGIRSPTGCSSCPTAEPFPPPNPLHLRASRSVQGTDDLAYLQDRVLLAETTGGWINVNFHDVCDACGATYRIRPALLRDFLAWLAPRAASHATVVLPMGQAFADDAAGPAVALTAPVEGAAVQGTVSLAADASDDVGVALVEFLVDGAVVASAATPPYTGTWDSTTVGDGTATLTARATDTAGNTAVSVAVAVTVANAAPVPAPTPPVAFELPFGSVWKYWDAGTDPGSTWFTAGFDDAAWASGPGQLGYGDGDEATVLLRESPRQPSVHFRRTVSLPGTPTTAAAVSIRYDDGFALWVNGTLVATRNVGSLASSAYATASEDTVRTVSVPANLLHAGDNQLAVMIKQRSGTSSDVSFDLQLRIGVQP